MMFDPTSQNPGSPALSTTSTGSASSGRNEPPKRLRYWLIDMIDSGEIPGLQWEDDNQTIFRITWKHAGKNNWNEEDRRIFKAWAEHREQYKQDDKVEAATLKTRLRCALTKDPDIKELKEKSYLEGNEPYQVYQLLPEPDKTQEYEMKKDWGKSPPTANYIDGDPEYMYHSRTQEAQKMTESPMTSWSNTQQEKMASSQISFSQPNTDPSSGFGMLSVCDAPISQQYRSITVNQLGITPPQECSNDLSPPIIPAMTSPNEHRLHSYSHHNDDKPNRIASRRESATAITMEGLVGDCDPMDMPVTANCIEPLMEIPAPHEMEIYIKYRGATVIAHHVTEVSGCRVHYGDASLQLIAAATHQLPSDVFGPESMDQIGLVECEPYASSEKQVSLTRHVLNNIKRGLILYYDKDKGCFYAKRLCQSRIYISGPESQENVPEKLERNTKVKVFDYKKFCDELRKFVPDGRAKLPETELHASFGQNWSIKTPINKNLVTLCMVPRAAKFMIDKVKERHNNFNNRILKSVRADSYDGLTELATVQWSQCVDELIRDISF